MGPCIGAASKEDYGEIIKQVELFLEGNTKQIVNSITDKMNAAAQNLEFEKAATLRDQVIAIEKVNEGQKVLSLDSKNIDIIGCSLWSSEAWVEVFFIRQGKLIGRDNFLMEVGQEDELPTIQNAFINQLTLLTKE